MSKYTALAQPLRHSAFTAACTPMHLDSTIALALLVALGLIWYGARRTEAEGHASPALTEAN